ncbi:Trehalose transport system permease protein SugB [subsurface metagenome]
MIREKLVVKIFRWLLLMTLLIIFAFPLYWMIVTSLQPVGGFAGDRTPYLIPKIVTLESYKYIINNIDFIKEYLNSLIVSISTTFIVVFLSVMAAYGFSRFTFIGKQKIIAGMLIFQMFPKIILVIPFFIFMRLLGLLSTNIGLIISYTSFALPFTIWLLVGFFDAIPKSLDECAMIDGATPIQAFYKIVLPLAAPGVVATALFAFVLSWQEYLFALVLSIRPGSALLTQGLAGMIQEWVTLYEPMMAGAVLAIFPLVIIYFFLEKYLVSGLTAGAVKE